MEAIILAAGEGSRLRPHTLERPKCLVPLAGAPLLETQLAVLRAQGIDDIVLVGGYRAEQLASLGPKLILNPDYAQTNMVWTLFCARQEFPTEGGLIVAYGDIVYGPRVLRALLEQPGDMVVAVDKQWEAYWRQRFGDPLRDAETLALDQAGRISEIGQKPRRLEQIQGQYLGLMRFSAAGLARLAGLFERARQSGLLGGRPLAQAYMTDLLQAAIQEGAEIWPAFCYGEWVEIDTPQDLALAENHQRVAAIRAGL